MIGRAPIDDELLQTSLSECEAISKSRPLTHVDKDSVQVIQPSDLIAPVPNKTMEVTRQPRALPKKKMNKCCERPSPPATADSYQNPTRKDVLGQSDIQIVKPDQKDLNHSKLRLNLRPIVIYSYVH
ncbi:unnamed protein product [Toxocara canis]|uniref:Uncharacterized protein n=1 Tax=Toxocara canis TaxID=6265 RepID=A0A183U2X4_TOXCA|nr:unnamed protein product [Toxocara canis]